MPYKGDERPNGRRSNNRRDIQARGGVCKCILPIVIFIVILGVAFAAIFGFIPIDELKNFLGMGNGTEGGTSGQTSTPSPTAAPVELLTCDGVTGDCCNGMQSNCDLTPDELFWPTVHNAMHDDLLGNNRAPLEEAIEAGYRGLLLDVCKCENQDTKDMELIFCHGFCAVGKRTFGEVFTNMDTFLNENPTETLLIELEISVGNPTPQEIWNEISQYEGIKRKTYLHNSNTFPTLKALQQDGRQILLFKHNGVDCSNTSNNGCAPRILEFHKYAMETEYEFQSEDEIENYPSSCPGTRGTSGRKDFYHINHFVTKWTGASFDAAKVINQKDAIINRINACEKLTKLKTSMVSIDFWQQGSLLEVAQEINKSRAKRRRSLRKRFTEWINF